jgi:hypothetical protein
MILDILLNISESDVTQKNALISLGFTTLGRWGDILNCGLSKPTPELCEMLNHSGVYAVVRPVSDPEFINPEEIVQVNGVKKKKVKSIISIILDPLKTLTETPIGVRGMKIDRMFFQRFETQIRNDPVVSDNFIKGKIDVAEEYIKTNIFDKPEDYINLDKIRKALNLDRRVTLREVLEKIFGRLDRFKTKDELLEEEFDKFISIYKPESQYVMPIKNFLKAYITDAEIREIIDKGEYSRLATNPKVSIGDIKSLAQWKEVIPGYVKDYVSLNIFM